MKVCSIEGCQNPAKGRGMCAGHYIRFMAGKPVAETPLRARPGSAPAFLEAAILTKKSKECIFWPYNRNHQGRAQITIDGQGRYAHRVVCTRVHGEPPFPKAEAAHSCGNGHLGCINPHHLRWATRVENSADMVAHGTRLLGQQLTWTKLTEGKVRAIREFAYTCSTRAIADLFDTSPDNVRAIVSGKTWKWLA